nr:MAG TPA: hypothetical protein [Microviridae sp.]
MFFLRHSIRDTAKQGHTCTNSSHCSSWVHIILL